MNFNVYVSKKTGEKIAKIAGELHRSRNSIITEALEQWLNSHSHSKWPAQFFEFAPIHNAPDFISSRKELGEISEDPLA